MGELSLKVVKRLGDPQQYLKPNPDLLLSQATPNRATITTSDIYFKREQSGFVETSEKVVIVPIQIPSALLEGQEAGAYFKTSQFQRNLKAV